MGGRGWAGERSVFYKAVQPGRPSNPVDGPDRLPLSGRFPLKGSGTIGRELAQFAEARGLIKVLPQPPDLGRQHSQPCMDFLLGFRSFSHSCPRAVQFLRPGEVIR